MPALNGITTDYIISSWIITVTWNRKNVLHCEVGGQGISLQIAGRIVLFDYRLLVPPLKECSWPHSEWHMTKLKVLLALYMKVQTTCGHLMSPMW